MRYVLSAAFLVSSTAIASAGAPARVVPEIDALSGLAALGLVGAVSALIWERRRR